MGKLGKRLLAALLAIGLLCGGALAAVPASAAFSTTPMVAAGHSYNLSLKSDGTVWAWGNNSCGTLGNGTTAASNTPVQVMASAGVPLTGMIAISTSNTHSLALKSDGTVWAWGDNRFLQLGDGTTTDKTTPVQVLGVDGSGYLTGVTAIAAGSAHSLALKSDGTVWAWGSNSHGEFGNDTTISSSTPVQVKGADGSGYMTGVTAIAAGDVFSLALRSNGTVWAWGHNGSGNLGDGTTTNKTSPVQVKGAGGSGYLTGVTAISTSGGDHSLALKSDGTVWAWGYNSNGCLGDGTTTNRNTPVQVKGADGSGNLTGVTAISAGNCSLALKSDGTVWAWGYNGAGLVGNGPATPCPTPVQVHNISNVMVLSVHNGHGLTLKNDGTVWTWGYNYHGELGNGTTDDSLMNHYIPVQVVGKNGAGFFNVFDTPSTTYTIAYNANGGSVSPTSATVNAGSSVTTPTPNKSYTLSYNVNGGNAVSPSSKSVSCTCNGWFTATSGGTKRANAGASYTPTQTETLYAQWANPAMGTLPTPTHPTSGYTFKGWFTAASGGTQVTSGTAMTGNQTIYAQWDASTTNIYNLGEETYRFNNYTACTNGSCNGKGHCFGMSATSSAYYLNTIPELNHRQYPIASGDAFNPITRQ